MPSCGRESAKAGSVHLHACAAHSTVHEKAKDVAPDLQSRRATASLLVETNKFMDKERKFAVFLPVSSQTNTTHIALNMLRQIELKVLRNRKQTRRHRSNDEAKPSNARSKQVCRSLCNLPDNP
uniref:Uncharacterized protein n=1 Tax=Dunaliella viridis TaxID=140095 RepID=Q0ZBM8_9CHLO|nr:hypothetical protein [Dunaliella viridis]